MFVVHGKAVVTLYVVIRVGKRYALSIYVILFGNYSCGIIVRNS